MPQWKAKPAGLGNSGEELRQRRFYLFVCFIVATSSEALSCTLPGAIFYRFWVAGIQQRHRLTAYELGEASVLT